MAREVRRFSVTIPANTPKSAGFTRDLSFPARVVRKLEVLVPPGPRGEVGFAIGAAGQAIIPFNAGAFIVTNDELVPWELTDYHDSGSWTFFGYNTGRYPHTLEVRFEVDLATSASAIAQPIDPAQLVPTGAVAVAAQAGPEAPGTPGNGGTVLPGPAPPPALEGPPSPPTGGLGAAPPALAEAPALGGSIARLYTLLLSRPPDPAGAAGWLALSVGNGGPLNWPQLVIRFAATPEALADARAAPTAFVAALYTLLLGRAGAAAELGYWTGRLRSPQSPGGDLDGGQVAAAIALGPEAQAYGAGLPVGP